MEIFEEGIQYIKTLTNMVDPTLTIYHPENKLNTWQISPLQQNIN